jgi:galactose mutarotase-like enzyme
VHGIALSLRDEQPTRVLISGDGLTRAEFVPGLGMVCCSLSHGGEELLGQRGGLRAYAESGSTMGVPLLHPWANRLAGSRYAVAGREVELDRLAAPAPGRKRPADPRRARTLPAVRGDDARRY